MAIPEKESLEDSESVPVNPDLSKPDALPTIEDQVTSDEQEPQQSAQQSA